MAKKRFMGLATINTILNTAPMVIQGATHLIKLIRDQGKENISEDEIPDTIDGIKQEVDRLHQRMNANNESNVEQTKLIKELAKQNETLAEQLKKTITHLNRITILASIAIMISIFCLIFLLM
jgi:predicted PurR-regulated permease PerM